MKKSFLVAMAMGLATAAVPANAAISIGVSVNGGPIQTVATDSSVAGSASYTGYIDPTLFLQLSGTGFPIVTQPELDTNSVNAQTSGSEASNVMVYITQSDLTSFSGSLISSFTSQILSGSASSVTEATWLSTSNAIYAGTLLADATFTGIGTQTAANAAAFTGPFSETAVYSLNFNAGRGSFNDTINISGVPEPSTWGLMLLGFAGMGLVMRRRKQPMAQLA